MNTPDPTNAITDTNLKNRLLRHLDACLKEIDADILAMDKRYENVENFSSAAMREMNPVKSLATHSDALLHHNKISTFNSDLTVAAAALNLSMNSSSTAVSDQDENNNGTDDNTFESSSSFHSTRSEQQSHHDIETTSSCRTARVGKRNFRECVEKTEETRMTAAAASKKPRPKSDEMTRKMVKFLCCFFFVHTIRLCEIYMRGVCVGALSAFVFSHFIPEKNLDSMPRVVDVILCVPKRFGEKLMKFPLFYSSPLHFHWLIVDVGAV